MFSDSLGPGTVLDGKYEILSKIGAGGMGEVFKARHLHLDAFRCIKVMKQGLLADDVYRMRFLREARLATQIHHPNVAVVHDFFIGDGGNYMVTEFIDGTTLRQWGAAHGPFPVGLAADVAAQVLAGLEHIHRRGLLHRDISPDNVMLFYDADDRLVAKIIDLGIVKDTTTSADKTQAGVLIGNPKYMSPEQLGFINDGEEIDARADLYCLGVVLYEMIVGVPPFASETPHGYIMKHLTQAPMPFRQANPRLDVSAGLEATIFRALEKDRARRYGNARELSAALSPFLTGPAGSLAREDVARMRAEREPAPRAPVAPDSPTVAEPSSTEVRAHAFELALVEEVEQREHARDRAGLQRLAEAHPPGTLVGDSAREALARLHAEAARKQRAETAEFEYARKLGTHAAWRLFLTAHPNGAHSAEAREQLAALERVEEEAKAQAARDAEPRDFDAAWEAGTTVAWDTFLRVHPESPRIAEARRCRQEAADYELAIATNAPAMWRAFLKSWPEGRHRIDAAVRLRAVR